MQAVVGGRELLLRRHAWARVAPALPGNMQYVSAVLHVCHQWMPQAETQQLLAMLGEAQEREAATRRQRRTLLV